MDVGVPARAGLGSFVHRLADERMPAGYCSAGECMPDTLSVDTGHRHYRGFHLHLCHVVHKPE
jgi:hypothetical protein